MNADPRDVVTLALTIARHLKEEANSRTDVDEKLYCYEQRSDLIIAAREIDFMSKNFNGIKRSK